MNDDNYYSIREMSEIMSVHPNTLYKLIKEKKIPVLKFGKAIRLSLTSVAGACRVPAICKREFNSPRLQSRKVFKF